MTASAIGTTSAEPLAGAREVLELPAPLQRARPAGSVHLRATCWRASLTKLTRSRPRTLTSTSTRRCSDSRLMTAGPSVSRIVATEASGTSCPLGEPTSSSPNASGVSVARRQQQHQVEAARALEDLARRSGRRARPRPPPARRSARDAVAGQALPVGLDLEQRQAQHALHAPGRRGPGTSRTTSPISSAVVLSTVEVLAEHLDDHVGARAGEQLVHAILDRLRDRRRRSPAPRPRPPA